MSPIRPERFARLVTLAGLLIEAARQAQKLDVRELCETLQVTEQELRQDIDVLNVVNFGGGSYVLYAEVQGDQIEVDPEPYGDNFARPARLLPLEAKALAAAEQNGIVFLDEMDKIASRSDVHGADVSRQGVQRDLLPIVEGTTVATKYGMVKTDHILFIASGAFHIAKPSDLLP